jgi:hypothetical protein
MVAVLCASALPVLSVTFDPFGAANLVAPFFFFLSEL